MGLNASTLTIYHLSPETKIVQYFQNWLQLSTENHLNVFPGNLPNIISSYNLTDHSEHQLGVSLPFNTVVKVGPGKEHRVGHQVVRELHGRLHEEGGDPHHGMRNQVDTDTIRRVYVLLPPYKANINPDTTCLVLPGKGMLQSIWIIGKCFSSQCYVFSSECIPVQIDKLRCGGLGIGTALTKLSRVPLPCIFADPGVRRVWYDGWDDGTGQLVARQVQCQGPGCRARRFDSFHP